MKDQEIIRLFFERSEQAITQLTVRYGTAVRNTVAYILRDPQDAEECINDTYLQVWNSIPPQHPTHLGSFTCRIARNVALNRHHFNTAAKRSGGYDAVLDELAESIPAPATVESACEARELAESINRFLAALSPDDRIMFIQRYWLGAAVTQIALEMGLTQPAVSVRLFRIRKRLKNYLRKEGIIA